jgi:tRNA(Arg) A34 adenosine deaminase TadA
MRWRSGPLTLGRHPFGAVLVAPDGETVLAEQGNVDSVNHAESTLARTAAQNYAAEYLWPAPWSPR